MRQRITFLHKPEDAIDPKSIKITSNSLAVSGLNAAREDRITFGIDELPKEIYYVLEQSHELHIRYVNSISYEPISPLLSKVSPGLHVYYSPQRSTSNSYVVLFLLVPLFAKLFSDLLCSLINKIFSPVSQQLCQSPEVFSSGHA